MEKLSTECLKGLRDRIDSILKERAYEEEIEDDIIITNWDQLSTWEERRKLYLDKFEAYIEKFNEMFPLFIEAKRRWLTADTVSEHGGHIDAVPGFRSWDWDNLLQDIKSNKIFIPYNILL